MFITLPIRKPMFALQAAAEKLVVGVTVLKTYVRNVLGVKEWPCRKRLSLRKLGADIGPMLVSILLGYATSMMF